MANYITDEGICLRVVDFSETSQIVGMFTRGHGLVPLIAKGAKRQSKKNVMSGPLDLLTSGEVVFVPAKETPGATGAQLGTLAAWELADHRRALRGNLAALNCAMMCAEVTAHLMQPMDPHPELFDELEAALGLLAGGPENTGRVLVAYTKAALVSAGYWPRLEACAVCGKPAGEVVRFMPRSGGICCGGKNGCRSTGGLTLEVPGKVVVALERLGLPMVLAAHPPARAADAGALAAAMELMLAQVEAVTDKGMRTRHLLKEIFGAGEAGAKKNRPLESGRS